MAESSSTPGSAWNARNPAVKRILQEMRELQQEDSPDFVAQALEDDLFEVHFVIAGPRDTDFEGGLYHGRITLPPTYPHAPPEFRFLTPNGRFETGVKICLSISSHHPEHWQPSWGVRTALTALAAFLPTPGHGAIGALDHTPEERRAAAAASRRAPPKFGGPERQAVTDALHARILARQEAEKDKGVEEQREQQQARREDEEEEEGVAVAVAAAAREPVAAAVEPAAAPEATATSEPAAPPPAPPAPARSSSPRASPAPRPALPQPPPPPAALVSDRALAMLALVLAAAVAILLARKLRAALLVGDGADAAAAAAPLLAPAAGGSSAAGAAAAGEL